MSQGKITIISIYYPPEQGAAASRIAKMAIGLHRRNVDVNVITALPNYPTGRIFPNYRRKLFHAETIDQISVRRFWLYPSNSTTTIKRFLNIISFSATLFFSLPSLFRTRPEAIIVNSPPLPVGLTGVILAKIVRARLIANISDIWPLSALELGAIKKGWFYSLLEKIEHYVYRYSDAIMTQSNETRHHILEQYPDKKTFLYRNLDATSEFINQFPMIENESTKIVYAGLLGVAQGVYDICRSIDFKSLGAEFHVYGDGNEKAKIDRFISENPDRNIFVHDTVPKSDIPRILAKFHATIVPLRSNIRGAFPSKIYMAISASLPVLYCGSGEGAQFVQESGIGWVSGPRDYQGLSKHISTLGTMVERDYQILRKRIKFLATNTYDVEEQLNHLLAFINNIK